MTEAELLPTEVILTQSRETLAKVRLDWTPQPGNYLDLDGQTYTVLERRHRYQLKYGRYKLDKIDLYVQSAIRPEEQSLIDGQWVIGQHVEAQIFDCLQLAFGESVAKSQGTQAQVRGIFHVATGGHGCRVFFGSLYRVGRIGGRPTIQS